MKRIITALTVIFSLGAFGQTRVQNVDATTFKKLINENKGILIDLRTDEEIEKKGKIKGAIQIDYFSKNSETEIAKLDKKKSYLIYCAGGGRSAECGALMEKKGFKEITNLEKGFDAWKKSGFEIEMRENPSH